MYFHSKTSSTAIRVDETKGRGRKRRSGGGGGGTFGPPSFHGISISNTHSGTQFRAMNTKFKRGFAATYPPPHTAPLATLH